MPRRTRPGRRPRNADQRERRRARAPSARRAARSAASGAEQREQRRSAATSSHHGASRSGKPSSAVAIAFGLDLRARHQPAAGRRRRVEVLQRRRRRADDDDLAAHGVGGEPSRARRRRRAASAPCPGGRGSRSSAVATGRRRDGGRPWPTSARRSPGLRGPGSRSATADPPVDVVDVVGVRRRRPAELQRRRRPRRSGLPFSEISVVASTTLRASRTARISALSASCRGLPLPR